MPQLYVILPVGGNEGGHPDQGLPGGGGHPGNRPPGSWGGEHPGNWVPGQGGGATDPGWGGGGRPHPGGGPMPGGGGGSPDQGLPIQPPQGGTEVPESEYQPLPPPEDIYSQYVVSVWNPKTASWTTKSYPPR